MDPQLILANLRGRPLSLASLRDAVEQILLGGDLRSGRYRLSKKQLAEREGVSPRSIDRRVRDGTLPPPDIINKRCFWWSDALERHERERAQIDNTQTANTGRKTRLIGDRDRDRAPRDPQDSR